ncbi:MAG: glycosyltransferase family 2 protein [Clostridia bacterium]|nr:glycosyltransferase family 2 protein [Clostridia bacterium]
MEEQIDILLATYNGEKYIKEQIDSILNQTYKNIKLIVSDDCSKDGTVEILKEYEQKDKRVELHLLQENVGVVKNIEFLLNNVQAPYYMLADQDDYWMPEKVEKSLEKLKKENADLVFGDLEVVDENLNTIYPSFNDYMLLTRKIKKYIGSYKVNYLYNSVTGCTVLAKKETIDYILPLPTTSKHLIHDHWIALMVALHGKLAYMPEKYIKYRQHGNNQVGTEKISHKLNKIQEVRELFINVKLGVFGTYIENNNRFPENIQKLNKKALNYFLMIQSKKEMNFKGWTTFHKLYKTEKFMYYIENFLIMNMPLVSKGMFSLRRKIIRKQ